MADHRDWRNAPTLATGNGARKDATWAFGVVSAEAPDVVPDASGNAPVTPAQSHPAVPADAPAGGAGQQIVFIEGSVADYQALAHGVQPGVAVVILNPDTNGVQQIADYLQRYDIQNLAAISIVADGAHGELQLGNTLLSASTIADYQPQLAAIGAALAPGGDLLLYGCDVAQNSAGDAFLQQLSQATGGANVAASSHLVGSAADGGNWDLNVDIGTVAAASPFTTAAESAYPDVLGLTNNQIVFTTWNGGSGSDADGNRVEQFGVSGSTVVSGSTIDLADGSQGDDSGINYETSGVAVDTALNRYYVFVSEADTDSNAITIQMGTLTGGGLTTVWTDPLPDSDNSISNFAIPGGLALDAQTNKLYFAQAAEDQEGNTVAADTGIYVASIEANGSISIPALLTSTSAGLVNPDYLVLDPSANLAFFDDSIEASPGFSATDNLDEVNLSSGSVTVMESFFNSSDSVDLLQGLALNGNTLYLTTVDYASNTSANNQILSIPFNVSGSGSTAKATVGTATTLYHGSGADQPTDIVINAAQGIFYTTGEQFVNAGTYYGAVYEGSLSGGSSLTEVLSMSTVITNGDAAQDTDPMQLVLLTQPTITVGGTADAIVGGSAVTLDAAITVADPDGQNLASATITGALTGDTLSFNGGSPKVFSDGFTITPSFSNGTLTLSGNASPADYQAALDDVTFAATSTSTTARTLDWTVSDGVVSSPTTTSTVDVHAAPTVTAGGTATFDGGGNPVTLDPGLTVTDPSSTTLDSATIVITGFISADRLNFSTQNSIAGNFDPTTGTLALSGVASVADYDAALESITYSVSPSDSDPTDGGSDTSRTIDWTVNDGVLSSSVVTSTLDTVHVAPTLIAGGTVTFGGGGSPVTLDAGLTVSDVDSTGVLSSATVTIARAITGDTLNFSNTDSTTEGDIALASDSNGVLVLTSSGSTATLAQWQTALESVTYSFSPSNGDPTDGGADTSRAIDWVVNDGNSANGTSNIATSTLDTTPCFAAGTRIGTERGEVVVEQLRVGDRVASAFGGTVAVTWLGHRRVDCRRHPKPWDVWPVRVAADAFGPGQPRRDLWLSPDHAVFTDGVLIPIRYLINDATIAQEPVDAVTYWHVELPIHDVLFAEGLPAESYLDTGNRGAFANGGGATMMQPDFALRVWEAESCAELVCDGAELAAVRSFLLDRAEVLGHASTCEPGLHLMVDGRVVRPVIESGVHRFRLPSNAMSIRLGSRSAVPAHVCVDSDDCRRLGVAVAGVVLDGEPIALSDARLGSGWHAIESDGSHTRWRWTRGDAEFLFDGASSLDIDIVMTARYWIESEDRRQRVA
jgi:hypothetical protein